MPNDNRSPRILSNNGTTNFFAKNGTTTVLKLGEGQKPELVANNEIKIEDNIVYGVAFVDNHILMRTGTELICIAEPAPR